MRRERLRSWLGVGLLLVATFVLARVVSGQTARPTATIDDLLAEIRGLRAEINQVAAAGIRAQLLSTAADQDVSGPVGRGEENADVQWGRLPRAFRSPEACRG